ncbi:MAG: T9SS type A sorting domain-containing protein [Pseudarcicella sp.]|nr:T9SS type A sorting domain-containing protein [Pseudarcicella sp.]
MFLIVSLNLTFSQIKISSPINRSIFQRNNSNQATITIIGSFSQQLTEIQAKCVPLMGGTDTGWQTITTSPAGGVFSGTISANGGWYRLEIQGLLNGVVVSSTQVEKIGVGEVFIIAGQSNAGAGSNMDDIRSFPISPVPTYDDRVNTIDFEAIDEVDNNISNFNNFNYPTTAFKKLAPGSNIGPRGTSPWCWEQLGNLLANKLNVPVLFFNVGMPGTSVRSWSESATNGWIAYSDYAQDSFANPYGHLKAVLNRYCSYLGLRSILWVQGETDNFPGKKDALSMDQTMTGELYEERLKLIINKSKADIGRNFSWAIAQASLVPFGHNCGNQITSSMITGAQMNVTNTTDNTFIGPNLDLIQNPRFKPNDCIHHHGTGLAEAAAAWDAKLSTAFFGTSIPATGLMPTLSTQVNCATGTVTVNIVGNFKSYEWSNGSNTAAATLSAGNYNCKVTDANGNIYNIPVEIPNNIVAPKLTISSDIGNKACFGAIANLSATAYDNYSWQKNNADLQKNTSSITANSSGNYSVTSTSPMGCKTVSEPYELSISTTPLPSKPTVSANAPLSYCDGNTINLTSSYKAGTNTWTLSNGNTSEGNTITTPSIAGVYKYTVVAKDINGCASVNSDTVNVNVKPSPQAPVINSISPLRFCVGQSIVLNSSYATQNIWSDSSKNQSININKSGNYSVKQIGSNGCISVASNNIQTVAVPLPNKPTIAISGNVTFCRGNKVVLKSSPENAYEWNNGAISQEIIVENSGTFSVKTINADQCKSIESSIPIKITVNENPATPTLVAEGAVQFCPDKNVTLTSSVSTNKYIWVIGQTEDTTLQKNRIVNLTNDYGVKILDLNNCSSKISNVIKINTLPAPAKPSIVAESKTAFCKGDSVFLKNEFASQLVNKYSWRKDNIDTEIAKQNIIKVKDSGKYSLKVADSQSGCFSEYSNPISITNFDLPEKPILKALRNKVFCQNDSTILQSSLPNTSNKNATYIWKLNNTLLNTESNKITVKSSGIYAVQTIDDNKCKSKDFSDTLQITSNPLPPTPLISTIGNNPFCPKGSVVFSANTASKYLWNKGETTQNIIINKKDTVSVKTYNIFGCESKISEKVIAQIHPEQAIPILINESNQEICYGDKAKLTSLSDQAIKYIFKQINQQTDSLGLFENSYSASITGNYFIKTEDINKCISDKSNLVSIEVKPKLSKPTLKKLNLFSLETSTLDNNIQYEWYRDNALLPNALKPSLKILKEGIYKARTSVYYSPAKTLTQNLTCFSEYSDTLNFKFDPNFNGISISPNPSKTGIFTLETKETLIGGKITIYDLNGRILKEFVISEPYERFELDLRQEKNTTYLLTFKNEMLEKTLRLIVSNTF